MIWAPLFAVTLAATVATGPVGDQLGPDTAARRGDALKATVNAATECVVRKIAADFTAAGVQQSEHQIRRTMDELMATAIDEIKAGK